MTYPTTELMAIVPVSNGRAPADALVVGPMREVMQYIPQSIARQDALEELEKAISAVRGRRLHGEKREDRARRVLALYRNGVEYS